MTENKFDRALRDLALSHAPKQIAKCGDIVTSQSYWKKPHNFKITRVAVEVTGLDLNIGQRRELNIDGWLTVQHEYIGRMVKTNGDFTGSNYGVLLVDFTTADGQNYKRIPSCFNHVGLVFDIDKLSPQ